MKKWKCGYFIPVVAMYVVFVLGNLHLEGVDLKGLFVLGLIGIMPLSFFVEGFMCCVKSRGFIIPLVISLGGFLVVILTILNDSACIYLGFYGVAYLLGYVFGNLIVKFKKYRQKVA